MIEKRDKKKRKPKALRIELAVIGAFMGLVASIIDRRIRKSLDSERARSN